MINKSMGDFVNEMDDIADKGKLCCCDKIRHEYIAIDGLYIVTTKNYAWMR